jgi:hypothetical protein
LLVAYGYARSGPREAMPEEMPGTNDETGDIGSDADEDTTPEESE